MAIGAGLNIVTVAGHSMLSLTQRLRVVNDMVQQYERHGHLETADERVRSISYLDVAAGEVLRERISDR